MSNAPSSVGAYAERDYDRVPAGRNPLAAATKLRATPNPPARVPETRSTGSARTPNNSFAVATQRDRGAFRITFEIR